MRDSIDSMDSMAGRWLSYLRSSRLAFCIAAAAAGRHSSRRSLFFCECFSLLSQFAEFAEFAEFQGFAVRGRGCSGEEALKAGV